jgi:tetratricopeptide (TPR) repeat protein
LLHIIAAWLIWAILRKLSIPGAFLAALLFAVHPVNVESVAWISQRKNTLSLFFFLLSILWYLRDEENRETRHKKYKIEGNEEAKIHALPHRWSRWYWLSLLAFLLAMLSKGSVAVLPVVLLLIVWWQRRRIVISDLLRTVPFFVVAVVLTAVNIWFQHRLSETPFRAVTFADRLAGAGGVIWFYLSKAMLPIDLSFVYPQWRVQTSILLWWLPLAAASVLTVILFLGQRRFAPPNWPRALLFAWTFFCVALVPVLGFTDVAYMQFSLVSDHYQYIAIIGVLSLVAAAWCIWHDSAKPAARLFAKSVIVFVLAALTFLSWRQSTLYADPITLYQAALKTAPDCWLLHDDLGINLNKLGRTEEAINQYRLTLEVKPDDPTAHYDLGNALTKQGHTEEAIEEYRQAIKYKSDYVLAHYNLANNLAKIGQNQEAIEQYREAVRLQPDFAPAYVNLGNVLSNIGQTQDAIEQYQAALQISQNFPQAHFNLGRALEQVGWTEAALEHYQQAVQQKPDYTDAYNNLGAALMKSGRPDDAVLNFQQALRLKPDFAEVYANLAVVYFQTHRPAEGVAVAKKGLEIARAQGNTAVVNHIEAILKSQNSQ